MKDTEEVIIGYSLLWNVIIQLQEMVTSFTLHEVFATSFEENSKKPKRAEQCTCKQTCGRNILLAADFIPKIMVSLKVLTDPSLHLGKLCTNHLINAFVCT